MAAHRYWRLYCHSHQTDATAFAIAELVGRTVSGGAQQFSSTLGAEAIVNGGFATATDWNLTSATISGGVLNCSGAANFLDAAVPPLTLGQTYQFSIDYNKTAGSKLRIATGAVAAGAVVYTSAVLANGAGTISGTFVAGGTHFRLEADTATYSGTIDNITVKPLTGTVVTASSVTGSQAASLIMDGNAATYWQAGAGTDGQWIQFDLGAGGAKDIIEIVVTARNDTSFYQAPNYAEWQWSDDGVTWTPYFYIYGAAYTTGSSQTFSGSRVFIAKTNLAVESHNPGAFISKTNMAVESRPSSAWAVISKTNLAVISGIPAASGRRRMSLM